MTMPWAGGPLNRRVAQNLQRVRPYAGEATERVNAVERGHP